ncbi:hypothetical protein ORS3428_28110 [Mesorhizobium sp. ORS 3428]|nr:hypothetical protein ORS3428_28110 [Mesorhizobium sp. ORS 3428]
MPAEFTNCRIDQFAGARDAANVIGRTQPGAFVDQCTKIGRIDADCLNIFRLKIVVLTWIGRQGNWMKTKTLGRLDV